MSDNLKNRLLSFAWRCGLAGIIAIIATATKLLPDLGLDEMITGILILILNEVSKELNNRYSIGAKLLGKKIYK